MSIRAITINEKDLEVLKLFGSVDLKDIAPSISKSMVEFNSILESRVKFLYNTPNLLSSVLDNKEAKSTVSTKDRLEINLTYSNVPVPLIDYPNSEETISTPTTKFPFRMGNDRIKWISKGYSLQSNISIRRGKQVISKRLNGLKGFVQNGKIYARKQEATWETYPTKGSEGVRAPIGQLFGPSLSTVATWTYDKDTKVKQGLDSIGSSLLDSLITSYLQK